MLYYPPPFGGPLFQLWQTRLFWKAPTGISHQNFLLGHLLARTGRFGGSKSALLLASFQGPTVSFSSKQGFFGKPRLVALTRTFLWVICSHPHRDLEARNVLYYPPPSRGPLFQLLANKAFLESPDH